VSELRPEHLDPGILESFKKLPRYWMGGLDLDGLGILGVAFDKLNDLRDFHSNDLEASSHRTAEAAALGPVCCQAPEYTPEQLERLKAVPWHINWNAPVKPLDRAYLDDASKDVSIERLIRYEHAVVVVRRRVEYWAISCTRLMAGVSWPFDVYVLIDENLIEKAMKHNEVTIRDPSNSHIFSAKFNVGKTVVPVMRTVGSRSRHGIGRTQKKLVSWKLALARTGRL